MEERPWCAAPSLPTGGVELHSPGNMSLRPSAAAPKRAWDSGESSSLPPARRRSAASHPSPKRENYVDKCLWKFPHNMSVNQFYQRPCRTRKQFLCLRSRNGFIRVRLYGITGLAFCCVTSEDRPFRQRKLRLLLSLLPSE